MTKFEIFKKLISMKESVCSNSKKESDGVSVTRYSSLVRTDNDGICIWSDAFQAAITENEHIVIPASDEPYYIDKTITVPSNRCIEALDGAVIRLKKGTKTLLLRNENNEDGTHIRETFQIPDANICIIGGRWEEEFDARAGYGKSGMFDDERSYYGVSTCMFFNNVKNLILKNLVFSHLGAFAVQMGNVKNIVIEDINFEKCFADGLHINGTQKIFLLKM